MDDQQPPKRPPGRPTQHGGEVKRAFFQTRIRPSLKARLEADAAAQGRSLSEEIELRLEDSYRGIEERFGGGLGLELAVMLFAVFNFAGKLEARVQGHPEWDMAEWMKDRFCFEEALHTLVVNAWNHHPGMGTDDEDFYDFCRRLFNWRRRLTRYEGLHGRRPPRKPASYERDVLRSYLVEFDEIARAVDQRFAEEAAARAAEDDPPAPGEDDKSNADQEGGQE